MKRSGWWRHSPALVIACLALFVALGGTVVAATKIDGRTIELKSIPGNRLAPGTVPGNRLAPESVTAGRLAPGSVKGDAIDAASLGLVPSAQHADSADTAHHAQTATAADHATDATTVNGREVGCEIRLEEFAGACWDIAPSEQRVTITEAVAECAAVGGELPSALTLIDFVHQPGVQPEDRNEWTKDIRVDQPTFHSIVALEAGKTLHLIDPDSIATFRCVLPLIN